MSIQVYVDLLEHVSERPQGFEGEAQNLRAGHHGWAALLIAQWTPCGTILLLHAFEHAAKDAILLDDCDRALACL